MPITIGKIELFCSLLFFSPTSLQRAKNACFSLIFPEKSAFRNGFELRRSDVKKDLFFNIFRRRSVESSSDNFRFFPTNTVSFDIYQKTRNQFDSNVTWVRIPPSAPKAAPYRVLLFIFAASYARVARWDSNSPARENPRACAKYHYPILHWVVIQFVKEPHHQAAQHSPAASKIQKYPTKACKQRRFHAQFASFFRFMAANLSLTHCVTRVRPLMWV